MSDGEAMSAVQQQHSDRWDRHGHRYRKGHTRDGYAVCVECGAHENEDAILQQCLKSSGGKYLDGLKAALGGLAADVDGLRAFEDDVIEAIGRANWQSLRARIGKAKDVLGD